MISSFIYIRAECNTNPHPYLEYNLDASIAFWKSLLLIFPLLSGSNSLKESEEVRSLRRRNMLKKFRISSTSCEDSIKVSTSCFPMVPLTMFPEVRKYNFKSGNWNGIEKRTGNLNYLPALIVTWQSYLAVNPII